MPWVRNILGIQIMAWFDIDCFKNTLCKTFVFSLKLSADLLALFCGPSVLRPYFEISRKVNRPVIFSLPFSFPDFQPSVKVNFDHCDYSSLDLTKKCGEHSLWRNGFILKEKGGFYSTWKYQLCNCAFPPFSPLTITLDVEEGLFLSVHLNYSNFCLVAFTVSGSANSNSHLIHFVSLDSIYSHSILLRT